MFGNKNDGPKPLQFLKPRGKIKFTTRDGDNKIGQYIEDAIYIAEETFGPSNGQNKLIAAADLVNRHVDIPGVPERIEGYIIRGLVQVVFSVVKSALHKRKYSDRPEKQKPKRRFADDD